MATFTRARQQAAIRRRLGAALTLIYPLDLGGTLPAESHGYIKGTAAWSGNCCQVRRISDSATLDIGWVEINQGGGFGCEAWDSAALDAFKGAESYLEIVTWYDHTGNGRHATQSTGSSRARYYGDHAVKGIKLPKWSNAHYPLAASLSVSRRNFDCYTVWDLLSSNVDSTISHLGDNSTYATFGAIQNATGFGQFQLWGAGSGNPAWRQASGRPSIYYHRGTAANTIVGQAHETHSSTAGSSATLNGGWWGRLFTGGWEADAFGGFIAVYGRNLSTGEQSALRAGLCTVYGCTDDPAAILIVQGDSIAVGSNYANHVNWVRQLALDSECLIFNVSSGGSSLAGTDTGYATGLGLLVSRYGADSLTILCQGTNDLTILGDSAATIYGHFTSLAGKIHAHGGEVLFATLTPNNAWNGTQQSTWSTLNGSIRSGSSSPGDGMVDFQANTAIGDFADAANTALYTDGLHGTLLQGAHAAATARAAVNGWLP